MADRHAWKRSLWGLDPGEAARLLDERDEPIRRERAVLEQAVALAETEAGRLTTECEALSQQVRLAEQRLLLIRESLARQRSLAPAQTLALQRQIALLEREHAQRLEQARRREEALQAEIAERRRSVHQWATELLRSVARRGEP